MITQIKKLFEIQTKPYYDPLEYSPWDIQVLSFKLLFTNPLIWLKDNLWFLLFSLPIVTIPAAKASFYYTIALGLEYPNPEKINPLKEMIKWIKKLFWRAMVIMIIKWGLLFVIVFSLYFWISQESWWMMIPSIIAFYALVMWWLMTGYLFPSLIENTDNGVVYIFKDAILLAFQKPFASLLFSSVSTTMLVIEIFLFGPMILILPSARAIIHLQGYWFLTGKTIPGFIDSDKYLDNYSEGK